MTTKAQKMKNEIESSHDVDIELTDNGAIVRGKSGPVAFATMEMINSHGMRKVFIDQDAAAQGATDGRSYGMRDVRTWDAARTLVWK